MLLSCKVGFCFRAPPHGGIRELIRARKVRSLNSSCFSLLEGYQCMQHWVTSLTGDVARRGLLANFGFNDSANAPCEKWSRRSIIRIEPDGPVHNMNAGP